MVGEIVPSLSMDIGMIRALAAVSS